VLVGVALILLGALVYGPQVSYGGFYWDDWRNAAGVHFTQEPGLFGALKDATLRPVWGYRPVLTVLLTVEYKALGLDKHLFLAMAALFGVSTAWALYLLLRTLRVPSREALLPAALVLIFPWADSTRMWNTASFDTLAVTFYLLGLVLALRGLAAPPGRRRLLLHAGSAALYLMAAWTYEATLPAIFAGVAVYLLVVPRRDALRRFGIDLGVIAVALAVTVTGTSRTPQSLGNQLDHAATIASQSFSLLTRALIPAADLPGVVGALLLVGIVGAALAARRPELRPWLVTAALGALCVAAGYLLFIPAESYYQPLAPGTVTRMNVMAAVGFSVLVYALVRLLAARVAGRHAPVLAALLLTAIAAGYLDRVFTDERNWHRSAQVQARVLAAVRSTVPDPPPQGATIYTFGAPSFVAKNIPTFSLPFDLRSAVKLQYGDPSVRAFPIRGFDVIHCEADHLYPVGGTYGPVHGSPYGQAWFVSVPDKRAFRVTSRAQCAGLSRRLGA
jgi:hypothetical protein